MLAGSAGQARRQPPGRTGSALRSRRCFFPWDSSGKSLEVAVPHPHGGPASGARSAGEHSCSWQPVTRVQKGSGGRAGVTEHVTHNGYSHKHAHRLSSSKHSPPLCLPRFASPYSQRCPFATFRGGRRGNAGGVGRRVGGVRE